VKEHARLQVAGKHITIHIQWPWAYCVSPPSPSPLTHPPIKPTHPHARLVAPQLGAVVGEKEGGQLTALRLMGLRQSAYWTSWVAADLLLGLATALSIVIWGE